MLKYLSVLDEAKIKRILRDAKKVLPRYVTALYGYLDEDIETGKTELNIRVVLEDDAPWEDGEALETIRRRLREAFAGEAWPFASFVTATEQRHSDQIWGPEAE